MRLEGAIQNEELRYIKNYKLYKRRLNIVNWNLGKIQQKHLRKCKARVSRSCTNYKQDKYNDTVKSVSKYIIVKLQEVQEDREIKKKPEGENITFREAKIRLIADFLTETNCKLSVLLHSAKILVRNEDFLLIHLTNIPIDGDTKGRKKISGGKSGIQEEKATKVCG